MANIDDPSDEGAGGKAMSRVRLPDWPRLMSDRYAAAYLGLSTVTFRGLDIKPRRFGRRVVWDRQDLDRYADRLGSQPQSRKERLTEAKEVERRFLERLKSNGTG